MAKLLYRLGIFAARRAWVVIAAWIAVLAIAAGAMLGWHGKLTSNLSIPGIEAQRIVDDLRTSFPAASRGSGQVVFHKTDGTALTAAEQRAISDALRSVATVDGVSMVVDPFETEDSIIAKRAQVTDGLAAIASGKVELADAQAKIDAGGPQLAKAETDLVAAQAKIDAGRPKLAAAEADLQSKLAQLDAGIAQAKAGGAPQQMIDGLLAQRQQLTGGLAEIAKQRAALAAGQAKIDAGKVEIAKQKQALVDGQKKIDEGLAAIAANSEKLALGKQLLDASASFGTVSQDGATALATVQFDVPLMEIEPITRTAVADALAAAPIEGVQTELSKELTLDISGILGVGEIVGLGIAAIVLFLMLGTLVGAGLPVIAAVLGVGISASITMALSGSIEMTSTTPMLGVMLGLAVGIDYALFIINRHRRQLKAGVELRESIGLANGTSGSAVLFAGITVVIALVALNLTGIEFLGLMGTMGAMAIVVAVLIALTFTPALLSLTGSRILSKRERREIAEGGGHTADGGEPKNALAQVLPNKHPWLSILAASAVVLIAALPITSMRLGLPDGSSEPLDSTQYRAFQLTSEAFGAGSNGQVLAVYGVGAPLDELQQLRTQAGIATALKGLDNVAAVVPAAVSDDKRTLLFQVVPTTGPAAEETMQLVEDIRALGPELNAKYDGVLGVTGLAAMNIDISQELANALPLYLGTVLLLSLLLLILVFRSIAVPLLASAGFLATTMATFGAVVAVYQWGWLGSLLAVHDPGPILSFLPTILIGITFGLAMDYQLFITSGMREAHIHGKTIRDSINYGVHLSRAVVVAAATIMIFVFGGFAFSHLAMIRPVGFGLAFGVLVDAFIVRLILVPAVMTILGERAWWIPRWLDRILPDVDIEGAALEREHLH